MLHRLYGSVHPNDRKSATNHVPVTPLDHAPDFVVLPMAMHVGAPCKPIVSKGDHVLLGQKIAEPTGLGAPIHASVSGTVLAVEPRQHPGGAPVLSVVIENDFQDTPAPPLERKADPENLTGWEVVDLIAEAGIVGLGGAGFPTSVKLKGAIGNVDTLIINGAECEPYITADHRLMLESGERVLGGVEILMRALGLKTAYIGVEGNKMDAIEHLRSLLPPGSGIKVVALKTRYPQGAEKQLIQKLTGRQVPPGKLPADVKCALFNTSTAAAVYDAVHDGLPLTRRIVTVSGGAVHTPRNLLVPIGTPLDHLLEECGGLTADPGRVLLGGPMMGNAQYDLHSPTIKGTNALLFLERRECSPIPIKDPPCIRCGRCVRACPMNLTPLYFDLYTRHGRPRELEKFHVMDCIECGSCAYVCPSHIRLVQSIRTAKNEIRRQTQLEKERQAALEKVRAAHAGKEANQ
ncbi:MAG: electron transport complex subunit RsxC [Oscillospiraceae bacterium]